MARLYSTHTGKICVPANAVLDGWGGEQKGFVLSGGCARNATSQPYDAITLFGGAVMPYQCVATSVAGFIQQLAVNYVARGYCFYVTGTIPDGKDPAKTDAKIIKQYGIDISKWARARRKRAGLANVHYLRHDRFYVIIAAPGEHTFFAAERNQIRNVVKQPLRFSSYAIGVGRSHRDRSLHVSVRIQREVFRELLAQFRRVAVHQTVEELCRELRALPFEPFAPVRDQCAILLRAVNRLRKTAGLELVPWNVTRHFPKPVRVFRAGED